MKRYFILFLLIYANLFSQGVGWGRKCELVIQYDGNIFSTLTNHPVLLTEDVLPSEMFDADGTYPALNGGGDIRFTSDEAGSTRLDCDVTYFLTDNNPANGIAEIRVEVPSISSSANTSIWIWYNKAGESQPARDASYGAEATYANFVAVLHLHEGTSTASDFFKDMSSSINHGTLTDTDAGVTQVDGIAYKAVDLKGSDDKINLGQDTSIKVAGNLTYEAWIKTSSDTRQGIIARGTELDFELETSSGNRVERAYATPSGGGGTHLFYGTTDLDDGVWHLLTLTYDQSTWRAYIDTLQETTSTAVTGALKTDTPYDTHIGYYAGGAAYLVGSVDEVRVSSIKRDSAYVVANFRNTKEITTFIVAGTPSSVSTAKYGTVITIF